MRPSNPVCSMSWMASTSLVERATTRPGGVAVVEGDVEPLEVPEDPAAQLE